MHEIITVSGMPDLNFIIFTQICYNTGKIKAFIKSLYIKIKMQPLFIDWVFPSV